MTQEALRMALEELAVRFSEGWHEGIKIDASDIMLLNEAAQALAQTQEPVGYWKEHAQGMQRDYDSLLADFQAQRTWVGLTDEEIDAIYTGVRAVHHEINSDLFARAIEAKLKEKNFV